MPVPACLRLADDVWPRVRAETARRLVADGWSQTRAAEALGLSQAMVSKYLSRGDTEDDALVLRLAHDAVTGAQVDTAPTGPSAWCSALTVADGRPGADVVMRDLLQAEQRLIADPPIHLVPQIGLNIAVALSDAEGPQDVLSFPGRIIAAGERLISPVPPAWGASNHLAACLLALRSSRQEATAIANLRADADIVTTAKNAGMAPFTVDRTGDASDTPVIECFEAGHPVVHDPGAVGIEPCLYISAADAGTLIDSIQTLQRSATP